MVAFGDSFGAIAPPEVGLTYRWPFVLCVNGAGAGAVRVAVSSSEDATGCPDWMVVGLAVDLRRRRKDAEPGADPGVTDLFEEGCGELTRTELLDSYARHLMAWIHTWETEGFGGVHEMLLFRAQGHREDVVVELAGSVHEGRFVGLDDHGSMILETREGTRLLDVLDAVEIVETSRETA
jgi:biotin-(acetyl-CoA carboxylase) ligase